MAITWRNIDIGGAGAANALLASGSQSLTRGIEQLAGEAARVGQTQSANWDQVAQNNTVDIVSKLNTYTSSQVLDEAIQGGEFSIDTLDTSFGRQYNKAAVSQALESKRNSLRTLEQANKLATEAEANKLITVEKNRRIRQFDAMSAELMSKYTDPNELQSNLWKAARSLNSDGLIPMGELGQSVDSVVNRVKGVGLDEASQLALKIQQDRVPGIIEQASSSIDRMVDKFKRDAGFDVAVDRMASDQMTVADATTQLYKQIEDKGRKPDTITIAARVEEVNNMFSKANLPLPNGRMVYEILTQGGHTGERTWINPFLDPAFKLNTDIADRYIAAIKNNQAVTENNADKLLQFAQAKANVSDVTSLAVAQNQSELLRAARSRAFTNEKHTPNIVDLSTIEEHNLSVLEALRRLKPSGIVTPTDTPKITTTTSNTSSSASASSKRSDSFIPSMGDN